MSADIENVKVIDCKERKTAETVKAIDFGKIILPSDFDIKNHQIYNKSISSQK